MHGGRETRACLRRLLIPGLRSGRQFDTLTPMSIAAITVLRQRQGELGQFFTPGPVAAFMASLFGPLPQVVRLLDAGAGAGSLTSAFVSRLCEKQGDVRAVEATLYEVDPLLQNALSEAMLDSQRIDRKSVV